MHFQSSLERGQVLPASTLASSVDVELIYAGVKYCIQVNKMGTSNHLLVMNGSVKETQVHRLKDGTSLMCSENSFVLNPLRTHGPGVDFHAPFRAKRGLLVSFTRTLSVPLT